MIYNLVEYLSTEFPAETIYANERKVISPATQVPDRNVLVRETGGIEKRVLTDPTFQIICRDKYSVKARELAYSIYNKLQSEKKIGGRFGLVLPAVTVGGVLYPAVQTYQISSLAIPQTLGEDAEGRAEFSMNFQIYT